MQNGHAKHLILVVGGNAEVWVQNGSSRWDIQVFSSVDECRLRLSETNPSIIAFFLDDCGLDHLPEVIDRRIPHVVIAPDKSFRCDLELHRRGFVAHLQPSQGVDALIDLGNRLFDLGAGEPFRAVLLTSSSSIRECISQVLKQSMFVVSLANSLDIFYEKLAEMAPDILVVEPFIDGYTADEIVDVLRQDERYLGLPVIIVGRDDAEPTIHSPPNGSFHSGDVDAPDFLNVVMASAAYARKLAHLVYLDGLTGLLTQQGIRSRLHAELGRAQREQHPLSLAMLDLDNFKQVNDTHGHLAGDSVIRAFSEVLSQRVRAMDIVGRYGGEEFVIVFPDTTEADAEGVVENIREEFSGIAHNGSDGNSLRVTVSAGIADLGGLNVDVDTMVKPEHLIGTADAALYRAKTLGRNRVVSAKPPRDPEKGFPK